jgi:Protein of unknown function (DUF2442)/Domain of unknown function (DUF4160)
VFAIDTLDCLGGHLLKARQRLVEAWVEIHRTELQQDWGSCNPAGRPSRSNHLGRDDGPSNPQVTAFQIVGPYTLLVSFADGTEQHIDFKPVLRGTLFGPLMERVTFEQVTLDPEAGTLVWPNGADFDPTTLHDWPQVRDELAARARTWSDSDIKQPKKPHAELNATRQPTHR